MSHSYRGISDQYFPLDEDERGRCIEVAHEFGNPHEFIFYFYLFTGLNTREGVHVRDYMVNRVGENRVNINIQRGSHECLSGGGTGYGAISDSESGSCQYCSERGGEYRFNTPRVVPVRESGAVEKISSWFQLYSSTPSKESVRRFVGEVGDEAGVSRLCPKVLRHSFGVMLAGRGFSPKEIATVMGISDDLSKSGLRTVGTYGKLCCREDPFKCGEETNTGDPCQNTVSDGGPCWRHE